MKKSESRDDLEVGVALVAGVDEMDEVERRQQMELPGEGSINLCLALHMLYFVADLERSLIRMARFLAPGSGLFIVLADESDGYTDHALRAFIRGWRRDGCQCAFISARSRSDGVCPPARSSHPALKTSVAVYGEASTQSFDANPLSCSIVSSSSHEMTPLPGIGEAANS